MKMRGVENGWTAGAPDCRSSGKWNSPHPRPSQRARENLRPPAERTGLSRTVNREERVRPLLLGGLGEGNLVPSTGHRIRSSEARRFKTGKAEPRDMAFSADEDASRWLGWPVPEHLRKIGDTRALAGADIESAGGDTAQQTALG